MMDHTSSSLMILYETRFLVSNDWATFEFSIKKSNAARGVILNKINFYFKIRGFI